MFQRNIVYIYYSNNTLTLYLGCERITMPREITRFSYILIKNQTKNKLTISLPIITSRGIYSRNIVRVYT